jgi:ribulose-bisphosphate carboxylase large chain
MQRVFVHFQKSGDKVITDPRNPYGIEWNVICELAGIMGVDSIHSGMWGGYMDTGEADLLSTLNVLRRYNVTPALSCGMHPGLVQAINDRFGVDYMANVGGAMHGHPGGTKAGALAMRQSIDCIHGPEYEQAIKKWGLIT